MKFYWVSAVLIVLPVCWSLVPEISLKSKNLHPTSSVTSTGNDVISETRTLGVGKWPTLNITRLRISSYNVTSSTTTTKLADRKFDVVDPDPNPSSGLSINSNTIHHLEPNSSVGPKRKKTRHRNKWKSPSSRIASAKTTPAGPFWTRNDILEPPTTKPPVYSSQLIPTTCQSLTSTCPAYRLVERRKEYDIRWYPSRRWASAIVMTEDDRLLAVWEGLAKLQEYFDGYNEPQIAMNLTYPLLTQVKRGKHPGILHQELRDITLSVPIPSKYQMNPPSPNSADILLDMVDSSTVFVHSFRARLWDLTDRALRHRADRLMTTLRNHGEAFHDRYYYLASFTKPDNMENNVYEMWIHATRLRDPGRVQPVTKSQDPPLSKVTLRTRKRLCRGVECPSFDVLRVYKFGIQKRRYFDTVLIQAGTNECEFNSLSVWRGFMPLHLYKHFHISHWEVLEATRPIGIVHVVDRVTANQSLTSGIDQRLQQLRYNRTSVVDSSVSFDCRHNLTVSLYLPQRLHSNPPSAGLGAPPVKINRVNDLIVYVQTVGGSILDPVRSTIEVKKFGSRLQQLGLCYKPAEYYLVIYDFMVRFHGRQNEIWFLADRCPVRSNADLK
ncbi:uncharacterized protein LOC130695367 isoform X2 [Daphnia carinata]|uniref:uncharacterized protein LOC130695367 isoform X2 n=1 Tax=Daphnia carinata TaxID=120202 RepID=UPI0025802346|nr:uncharacterized protein LOC130695367 isoform X2 [Daphnia carinata]